MYLILRHTRVFAALLVLLLGGVGALNAQIGGQRQKAKEFAETGDKYFRASDYKNAAHYYLRALKRDDKDQSIAIRLAQSYFLLGDYKKSSAAVKGWLDEKDCDAEAFRIYGTCMDKLGNADLAMRSWNAGLKVHPDAGSLYFELGLNEWAAHHDHNALEWWERGIVADPTHADNYYMASQLLHEQGDLLWSAFYAETFLNLEPNTARTAEVSGILFQIWNEAFASGGYDWSDVARDSRLGSPEFREVVNTAFAGAESLDNPGSIVIHIEEFLDQYEPMRKQFRHPVIEWWYKLQEAGHLQAYIWWLMADGSGTMAGEYYLSFQRDFEAFADWSQIHRFTHRMKQPPVRGMFEPQP